MKSKKLTAMVLITAMMLSVLTFAAPFNVSADDEDDLAKAIKKVYSNPELVITTDPANHTVTVSGTVKRTRKMLELNIDSGVTVIWKATYEAALTDVNHSLIKLTGGGAFEVAEGGSIESTGAGYAIHVTGAGATVNISGGTVSTAKSGNRAIYVEAKDVTVNISGGTVSSVAQSIYFFNNSTNGAVTISGGMVSSVAQSIYFNNSSGGAVDISSGTVSSAKQEVIYFYNSTNGAVNISGGTVSSAKQEVIHFDNSTSGAVDISGGFVFARGTDVKDVIKMLGGGTLTIKGTGIICAWDAGAASKEYTVETAEDIVCEPDDSAFWGLSGGKSGIDYAYGKNTGFFPIEGVTVKPAVYYTITFDSNGGDPVNDQVVNSGGKLKKPDDPAKSGYEFEGWYKDAACTVDYDFNTAVTAAFKLYAKWTAVKGANPAIDPTAADYEKDSGQDVAVTMKPGGHNLKSIKNGGVTLVKDTDYKIARDKVTLISEYLEGLALGDHTITFEFDGGVPRTLDFKLTVNPPSTSDDYEYTIGAGYAHTLAIADEGSLWAWGGNEYGQLGDGTTDDKEEPVQIQIKTKTGTKFTQVSVGSYHTMALDSEGSLWAWGWNEYGQLGDGTTTDKKEPVQIQIKTKPGTKFTQVAAGYAYSLAIDSEGNLWAWGWNKYGQLGDGTTTDRKEPVQIQIKTKPGTTFAQVAAGGTHTLAIADDGSLWAWGSNEYGQLGDGTTTDRKEPVQIQIKTKPGTTFAQVSVGGAHTLAIADDGNLWAWGWNEYGQLGDGTTNDKEEPVQIQIKTKPKTTFAQVAAGSYHTLAIADDGSLWAWGSNDSGQLGDGTTTNKEEPVQIQIKTKAGTTFAQVAAGIYHTVALDTEGNLWAWGFNEYGQLGDGTTEDKEAPVKVEPGVKPAPEDASITPTKATFDKNDKKDILITVEPNGYKLEEIKNGGNKLEKDKDYKIAGDKVTLTAEYLEGLAVGAHTLTFEFDGGTNPTLALTVTNATPPKPLPFTDVVEKDWFYDDVRIAYESGLINGKSEKLFAPKDNLTYSEAVKLAACMHQLYTTGKVTLVPGPNPEWYITYVAYAKANGIIAKDYDWNKPATRAGYMEIFANALPDEALGAINKITDGKIPDVPMTHAQAGAIYKLYRAGILQGVDPVTHECNPGSNIQRSEVAAILTRMMNPAKRVEFDMP